MLDYNELASSYAKHRQVHPEVLKTLLSVSGINHSSRVLEVGCGTGNYINALEQAVGSACWALEPSAQMLAKARQPSSAISFQLGSAEQLPYPAHFFDLLFSIDVIHHLANHASYFEEAYRVLRAGGLVCIVTDSAEIIRQREPLATYFPETIEVDLKRYSPISKLKALMSEVGFQEIHEIEVEFAYRLPNIQIYRDKAFSCLHLISEQAFEEGMAQLEQDLLTAPIRSVSRYLLLWGTRDGVGLTVQPFS